MPFTVKDALKLDIFKNSKVIAGHKGLDNEINWVNILEILDDIELLHENELLITTAFGLNNIEPEYIKDIFIQFHLKKLSALVIQTGYYIEQIPNIMKELANQYALPIIQLPQKASFSEITKVLSEKILEEDLNLEFVKKINTLLYDAIKVTNSLDGIANALNILTSRTVRIVNCFFKLISSSDKIISKEEFLLNEYNYLISNNLIDFINTNNKFYEIINSKDSNIPDQIIIPLKTGDDLYGYMSILKEGKEFTKKDLIIITQAANICSLFMAKKESIFQTKHNLIRAFFNELISENNISKNKLTEWVKKLSIPQNTPYHVCVIEINSPYEKLIRKITNSIEYILQKNNFKNLTTNIKNEIIILLFLPANKKIDSYKYLFDEINKNINQYFNNLSFYIGTGSQYINIDDFKRSYSEAKTVLEYNKLSLIKDVYFFKDIGLFRILYEINNMDSLYSYYKDTIGDIDEYDKKYNMDLINSLKVFLKYCNINKASQELYIHRHTLKYRLNKIKELTNLDPELPEHQYILNFGLIVRDYLLSKKLF